MEENLTRLESVRANFAELAETYSDDNRRKMIPGFEDFYQTGVSVLSTEAMNPRVLDLGAGTGLYAAFLFARYPEAGLTLVDFAEEMLEIARRRFARLCDAEYIVGDYMSADVGGDFDIIVSALSIHHLAAESKAALFRRVYSLLKPGGEFLNADQIIGDEPAVMSKYEDLWWSYCIEKGLNDEQLARMRRSRALDDPSSIADQVKWLYEAGFDEVDCVYKYWNFAVLYAKKG